MQDAGDETMSELGPGIQVGIYRISTEFSAGAHQALLAGLNRIAAAQDDSSSQ
jgi:hypothetical protein